MNKFDINEQIVTSESVNRSFLIKITLRNMIPLADKQ